MHLKLDFPISDFTLTWTWHGLAYYLIKRARALRNLRLIFPDLSDIFVSGASHSAISWLLFFKIAPFMHFETLTKCFVIEY